MAWKRYGILFFLLLATAGMLWSQEEFEKLNFVNIKEGISKRAVSSIIRDHYGFTWIGTSGAGLHRYDGINYKAYTYDWKDENSINSDLVYCIYLDGKNRLWIGTDNGLNVYKRDMDTFERIDLRSALSPGSDGTVVIRCLLEDNNGNLLVGTVNEGLIKVHPDDLKVSKVASDGPPDRLFQISALIKNKQGAIYAATDIGLKTYNEHEHSLSQSKFNTGGLVKEIKEPLESLLVDNTNNLWLGTRVNGIIRIREQHNSYQITAFPISKKRILSMLYINENMMLCGTENDGLIVIDKDGRILQKYMYNKFDNNSLKSNSIWSLHLDNENRIWLGYFNKGIGIHDKLYNKFERIESLPNNTSSLQAGSVTGIVKDASGKLWISMEGGGVDIYDPVTKEFQHINSNDKKHYSGLETDEIITIFIDSRENTWLCSWNGGIYFLKKGAKKFVNYSVQSTNGAITSDNIFDITEDSRGIIWIASFVHGLHYYDPEKDQFFHCNSEPFVTNGLVNSDIRVVLADSDDTIWLGATDGLYRVTFHEDRTFSVISMRAKMSRELKDHPGTHHILTLYESKDKRIWIGTDGGGLFVFHPENQEISRIKDIEGFNEKAVSSITESSDGVLWISGKSGITKLELNTNTATNFTADDGLLGNDFNNNAVFNDDDKILYFGSYRGINYVDPNQIAINKNPPSLYLTGFKLFNKQVSPNIKNSPLKKVISETESITLTHDQSVFTIEYVGINYTRPEKNKYAYYLEGFDANWNYVGNVRSATYTNLAQGTYTFKVKSANNDGVWNREPLELTITILPPWWQTKLAYFSYMLCCLVGFFALNKFLRHRFKEKQAIKFEREKRVQEEQLHNKKLQFFTNISHEFRTPLTLIINPLEDLINTKGLKLPDVVKEKHRIIHKNADRLSRLINELMDFRKLQSNKIPVEARELDVVVYVQDIVGYFNEEASHRNITLRFNTSTEKLMAWLDPNMVEKIIFNLLSNAFKVTPANGCITIDIRKNEKPALLPLVKTDQAVATFEISVRDTGPGLDQKEYKRIFKRFYQVSQLNKSYYGSTGIGLEMVNDFVVLHKGKIEVHSEIGKGTKFTVTFPLGRDHFSENEIVNQKNEVQTVKKIKELYPPLISRHSDETETTSSDQTHTLLIVEDNFELRNYLKKELSEQYKIIEVENGRDGLEIAKEKLPDVIITDVVMPVMDGFELCKNIKNDIKTSHIPLLMLTAKAMADDKIKGIDSGADAYISKPFDMNVVKSRLAQLLTSRQILFNKYYNGITEATKEKTTFIDNKFIQKVLNQIHENISRPDLSVEALASQFLLSRSQFYRKVKALTGLSPNEFIRKVRLEKAKDLLESSNYNINQITYKIGFSSPSYFTKCFKVEYGYLPTETDTN